MVDSDGKNMVKVNKVNNEDHIILEVENLYKSYGDKNVIEDLSFQVKKGESFAILGENGAGKTTLFKILLNISKRDKGLIQIMGDSNNKSRLKEKISFLGEDYELYPYLTAKEVVLLASSFYETDNKEWALSLLEKFDIPLNEKIKNFSKGMKQTVKLMQSLVNQGEIIILDEPTAGLDVKMQHQMLEILKDLNEKGKTIIFSSHNLLEVKKLADRIAFIKKGEIIAIKDKSFISKENNKIIFVPQKEINDEELVIDGVTAVEKNGSKYIIYYDDNEGQIIKHLNKIPYFKLKYDEPDLEEMYLKITGGDKNVN